jgi:hypothetical protein
VLPLRGRTTIIARVEGSVTPIRPARGAGAGGRADPEPDRVAVVAALRRMLDSEELRASPRSRDFLAYVVTEALAGRGHRPKERTVARYALGRTEDFDSVTDAAARVQANRLRASMERYYAGTGAAESLVIELPRGSYVPTFRHRETTPVPHETTHLEPGLVVVQFADLPSEGPGEPMALALTESLIHALSTFPGVRVIGPAVSERGIGVRVDAQAAARALDATPRYPHPMHLSTADLRPQLEGSTVRGCSPLPIVPEPGSRIVRRSRVVGSALSTFTS